MSDLVKEITLTTGGFGTEGFTFSVLSNQEGHTEEARVQLGDPHFDRDFDNQPFVAGVPYRFLGFHPLHMSDEEMLRIVFKETGGYDVLDPRETTSLPTATKITDLFGNANSNDLDRDAVGRAILTSMSAETLALLAQTVVGALTDDQFQAICQGLARIGCSGGSKTISDFRIDGPYRQSDNALLSAVLEGIPVYFKATAIYGDGTTGTLPAGYVWSIIGNGDTINQSGQWTPASNSVSGDARNVTLRLGFTLPGQNSDTVRSKVVNVSDASIEPGDIIYFKPVEVSNDSNPELAGGYKGSLESGTCDTVSGWIAKLTALTASQYIDIWANGVKVASNVLANGDRTDVRDYLRDNQNVPNLQFTNYGFQWQVPANLRTGVAITWRVYVAGTMTELTFSPRTSDVCADTTPTVVSRYIVGPSDPIVANEGGLGIQLVCKEELSNGDVRNAIVDQWRMPQGTPSVITISSTGVLTCANGLSNTVMVGPEAVVQGNVVQGSVQVIKTGCTRNNAGFISPKLVYNFVQNGAARLFSSLDDANNTMGAHFDGTAPGTFGDPYLVQLDPNFTQGSPVWLGSGNDCTKSSDGIRYVLDGNGNNTQLYAIRIENGLIAEAKPSTYQTTVVPPYENWIGGMNDFSEALPDGELGIGLSAPHGGVFAINNGIIHQTFQGITNGSETISVVYVGNGSDSRLNDTRILAKIRMTLIAPSDNRAGVGLNHTTDNAGGFNFIVRDANTVGFLYDHIAFGPTFPFSSQPNKWYWFAMKVEAGTNALSHKYSAKIWAEGTPEPSTWPFVWDNVEQRSGYPALVLGNVKGNSTADCDEWYYSKQMPL